MNALTPCPCTRIRHRICVLTMLLACSPGIAEPQWSLKLNTDHSSITQLGWDTEGTGRHGQNLLRAEVSLTARLGTDSAWSASPDGIRFEHQRVADGFDLILKADAQRMGDVRGIRVSFPFNPSVTPTTVLPSAIEDDGTLHLPAIVSAPDFGQMLVVVRSAPGATSHLIGSRPNKTLDWIVELAWPTGSESIALGFRPAFLLPPQNLRDRDLWKLARRGWFNAFNLTSQWGDQQARFSAPVGILGNNVLSDPASCSLWMYADMALFVPELPGGIKTGPYLRRSLDHWLDHRTKPDGNVICYWDYDTFLDPLPGILISAWDYAEISSDRAWLETRIAWLERIADYAVSRDIDDDGLIEAVPTGSPGELTTTKRGSCWFDAINFGHKDAYANALMYRGFRCLADLEQQLDRPEPAAKYTARAERLKQAYARTFLNPATAWVAMWKRPNGGLRDYASPIVNGYAIEYGLIDRDTGRQILRKLSAKLKAAGFTHFEYGVPCVLDPIRPFDYLQPAIGAPQQEDGRDTWQIYMNGGITPGQVYHYLAAHYMVGMADEADAVLRSMLKTQQTGGFQNGVQDAFPKGRDWLTWDGTPCGYEGFLADNARFLLAVLTREDSFRQHLYRPLALEVPP